MATECERRQHFRLRCRPIALATRIRAMTLTPGFVSDAEQNLQDITLVLPVLRSFS